MKKIYKYKLQIEHRPVIQMPRGAQILHAGEQFRECFVWALVDPKQPVQDYHFRIFGTGHPISNEEASARHIGTIIADGGNFVWHVFHMTE